MGISSKLRLRVYERDNFQCVKCKSKTDLTLDHVVPVSKGGGDYMANLVTMCFTCNTRKGNYAPSFWQRVFSWVFTRKEANKMYNDMIAYVGAKTSETKSQVKNEVIQVLDRDFKEHLEIRFGKQTDVVKAFIADYMKDLPEKMEKYQSERIESLERKCDTLKNMIWTLCEILEANENAK